jgi:hypothetical protein
MGPQAPSQAKAAAVPSASTTAHPLPYQVRRHEVKENPLEVKVIYAVTLTMRGEVTETSVRNTLAEMH